ncbi:hypothetical protein FNF31_04789 [Cafeteria roenbergensis]|uniref:Prolyl 4-hydroxylase alpha subunit Fe(2+) 2OG dioxygenase domain-containing protein n=1 Tax=Cafeteria roenbergensis TaxID=33653 RepID=A0A5A8D5M3_CAFRO|nr:hypothetical protein FNF31_04789 [Cafeteria roenbergensis]KAA0159754.1 hypothetical protein FNF28_05717 [Cafeteria roenbergensis]
MFRISAAVAAWLVVAVVLASPQTKSSKQPAPIDQTWRDGSGRVVLVSDTLVEPSATSALRSFASQFGDWRFVGPLSAAYRRPDVIAADEAYERRRPLGLEGFRFATDLHRPWFGQTAIARAFASAADRIRAASAASASSQLETSATVDAAGDATTVGGSGKGWHVLHAAVVNIRRGDAVRVAAACPPVAHGRSAPAGCGEPSPGGGNGTRACPGDVVALLMLTTATAQTKQDDYGEVTLFERLPPGAPGPADGVDSFAGARLRAGRALVFGCETPFRTAPPAVATPKAILLLRVVLTQDAQRAAVAQRDADSVRVLQGNSLPERLGFPVVLFDSDVVRPQEEVIAAMEAEEAASSAADMAGRRGPAAKGRPAGAAGVDVAAQQAAEAALEAAVQRTKAAKAAAQATIDEGDDWALPLSRKINLTAYEARVFETTGKRRVHLFDGLFADEESQTMLRQLRDHVVANASYSFDDTTNDEIADDTDNVQWIVGLDQNFIVRTKLWPVFRAIADHVTPWAGFWPYDVSVNVIRPWDHTLVHADCGGDELEYTLLLYLNDDLGIDDGAETVFFDDAPATPSKGPRVGARLLHRAGGGGEEVTVDPDDPEADSEDEEDMEWASAEGHDSEDEEQAADPAEGDADEDEADDSEAGDAAAKKPADGYSQTSPFSDVIAVVRPVFGRIAIFNGNVPHSARPPYGPYPGIRYTMAVKMTSSRVSSVSKHLASMLHGSVDELQAKLEAPAQADKGAATRRQQWERMLEQAETMYAEVEAIRGNATAADKVRWSGAKPGPGQPWSTTCLTKGPPAMATNLEHLKRLSEVAAQNHAFGEKVEQRGWQELAESLGVQASSSRHADI